MDELDSSISEREHQSSNSADSTINRQSNLNNLLNTTIYEPWYDITDTKYREIAKGLYDDDNIAYYDITLPNNSIKIITHNINEVNMKYETYCKQCTIKNKKPQSYSIYHFLHKNSLIFKTEELTELLASIFPTDIIKEIASYSNQIYAKGVRGGNIHFSYHSIIPTKHMYDNLKFRKQHAVDFTKEIGEIIYVFEKYHPNHLYITEGKYCEFDVVLYYEKYEVYSIFSVYPDADSWSEYNDIDLIDFQFHDSLLKE